MVLVSDKPSNDTGILQTKLSDRERHETRGIGLEAMPLDEDIEGRHGEGQARLKIGPAPVHDLFEMADERQPGKHRLDEHTVLPLTTLTQFQVGGGACRSMKAGVAQDNHAPINLANEPLKGVIRNISGGTRPPHAQPPLVEQETQFAPDDPPVMREAFPADLLRAATLAHGVDEFDAVGGNAPEPSRGGQESPRPILIADFRGTKSTHIPRSEAQRFSRNRDISCEVVFPPIGP